MRVYGQTVMLPVSTSSDKNSLVLSFTGDGYFHTWQTRSLSSCPHLCDQTLLM